MAAGANAALNSTGCQVNMIPAGLEAEKQLHAVLQWQSTVKSSLANPWFLRLKLLGLSHIQDKSQSLNWQIFIYTHLMRWNSSKPVESSYVTLNFLVDSLHHCDSQLNECESCGCFYSQLHISQLHCKGTLFKRNKVMTGVICQM